MATYRELHGKAVKTVTTNPTDDAAEGQIWFNSTDNKFKSVVGITATRSGSSMSTTRGNGGSIGSTRDASAVAGGYTSTANTNVTEEFNGSGFSTGGNLNTSRRALTGTGVITAGLVCAGYAATESNATEEYDGSAFSNGGNLNTARFHTGTFGTQTAGVAAGGSAPSPAKNVTEEYNGSAWTTVPATLSVGRQEHMAGGTETAGICCGGQPPYTTATEEYDGSAWTTGGSLNTARAGIQGSGIQTAAIVMGGSTPTRITSIETYNGTSWTTSPASLATARDAAHNAGTTTSAIVAGGITPGPSYVNTSEELDTSANIFTSAAWASGGAMSTARQDGASFGVQTSAAVFCGETPSNTNNTEHYNGSSWTSGGNYPASYTRVGAFGVLTAGVGYGGGSPYGNTTTAEYNGSAWTAVNAYPISIATSRGCGVLTAGLACGGDTFPPASGRNSTTSKEYDGTNWTAGGSLGTGRYASMVAGTQTAAVSVGGTGAGLLTEEYNGSSWSTSNAPLISMSFGGSSSAGTQDNMTTFATNSSPNAFVQKYNGTSFATEPSIATGRYSGTGAGTAATALAMGGRAPPFSTATEEFTGETTALNVKTLTQS